MLRTRWAVLVLSVLLSWSVLGIAWPAAPARAVVPATGGLWSPISPTRLADTRQGYPQGRIAAWSVMAVTIPDSMGYGIVGVNVTAVNPTHEGYLSAVSPDARDTFGTVSTLNFAPGATVANEAVVHVVDRQILVYNGSAGSVDVLVDVMFGFSPGTAVEAGSFIPIAPQRLLDVRLGAGAESAVVLPATSAASVSAAALNLTVDGALADGYVKAWPSSGAEPYVSSVNFRARQTVANAAIVQAGGDRVIKVRNGSSQPARVIVDLSGVFLGGTPTAAGAFHAVAPARVVDSRIGLYLAAPMTAMEKTFLRLLDRGGLPSSAAGVVANLTVTAPTCQGFVRMVPGSRWVQDVSNANYAPGQDVAGLVVTALLDDLVVVQSQCATELVVDVAGYFVGQSDVSAREAPRADYARSNWPGITRQAYVEVTTNSPAFGYDGIVRMVGFDATTGVDVMSKTYSFHVNRPYEVVPVLDPSFVVYDRPLGVRAEIVSMGAQPTLAGDPRLVVTELGHAVRYVQDPATSLVGWQRLEYTVQVTNRTTVPVEGKVARLCGTGLATTSNYGEAPFWVPAGSSVTVVLPLVNSDVDAQAGCWYQTFA